MKNYPLLPYTNNIDTTEKSCWSDLLTDRFLDKSRIDSIADDDTSGRMMTAAIPNPLARILLFKNAFNYFEQAVKTENYSFDGPYSYIVSDCLDLIQFIYEKPSELFEIKEWNIADNIDSLIKSTNERHQKLGSTLKSFMDTEFRQIGFSTIHLIYYKPDGENKSILIGGTSPHTLFYTSPNWNRYLADNNIKINSNTNDDIFFDEDPLALEKRVDSYKKYLYYISNESTTSDKKLPNNALSGYIKNVRNKFDTDINLDDIAATLEDYEYQESPSSSSIKIRFGEFALKRQKISTEIQSDLFVDATLDTYKRNTDIGGNLPLVIGEKMDFDGQYFNSIPYTKDLEVINSSAIHLRKIPSKDRVTGMVYPYLYANDFFADTLIKIPYQINDDQFYTGEMNNAAFSSNYQYLLPLTKTYFNFFEASTLNTPIEESTKRLQISYEGDFIVFVLNIPVTNKSKTKKSYVKLSKRYKIEDAIEYNIGLSMFPRLRYGARTGHTFERKYNIFNIVSFYEGKNEIELNFYTQESIEAISGSHLQSATRMTNTEYGTSLHYHLNKCFDYIEVKLKGTTHTGIVAPIFIDKSDGTDGFNAALDFGTSNTFVAFSDEHNSAPSPLTFDKGDAQNLVAYLNKSDKEGNVLNFGDITQGMKAVLQKEFVPASIGTKETSFPIRTVSIRSSLDIIDEKKNLFLFSNLAFYYDTDDTIKDSDKNYYEYITNIKQKVELSDEGDNRRDTKNILVELLWLIKCKVLLKGGALKDDKLKIIWTYPSTGEFRKNLISYFEEAKNIVFGAESTIRLSLNLSESIAPFIYLAMDEKMKTTIDGKAINIDIGGGTTDIVIKDSNKIGEGEYVISSVKFAGNDLWGNGIHDTKRTNGYIKAWEKKHEEKLKKQSADNIEYIYYDSLCRRQNVNASDKLNLLFKYNEKFEFTSIFNDLENNFDYLKLPLLLHISSILYYTLTLFNEKSKDTNKLFGISFSGKGSTYLKILFNNEEDIRLYVANYIKAFNTIKNTTIELKNEKNITLAINPKEVTAYGALYSKGDYKGNTLNPATNLFSYVPETKEEDGDGLDAEIMSSASVSEAEVKENLLAEYVLFFNILYKTKDMLEVYPKISPNFKDLLVKFPLRENEVFKNSLINTMNQYRGKDKSDSKFFYPLKNAIYEITELLFEKKFNEK